MEYKDFLDRDLLVLYKQDKGKRPEIVAEFLSRYRKLVHKQWSVLRKQMNNSFEILNLRDDFYADARVSLYKALSAVKESKIENDKWKFLGYYRFYLMSMRAEYIRKLRYKVAHEAPSTITRDSREINLLDERISTSHMANNPEELFLEKEEQGRVQVSIEVCLSRWDNTKTHIFKERSKGRTRASIAKDLKVSPAAITYHMNVMRKDLEAQLASD